MKNLNKKRKRKNRKRKERNKREDTEVFAKIIQGGARNWSRDSVKAMCFADLGSCMSLSQRIQPSRAVRATFPDRIELLCPS